MITIKEFKKLDLNKIILIDIREPWEYNKRHIKQAINIPKDTLLESLKGYKDKKIYLICETGNRTGFMTQILKIKGYDCVDILGGMEEYYLK